MPRNGCHPLDRDAEGLDERIGVAQDAGVDPTDLAEKGAASF